MITIVKGKEKIVCTKGTFEEQYKQLGYQIASKKKEATKKVASILKEEKPEKGLKDIIEEAEENNKINEKYGLKPKKGKKDVI